MTAWSMHAGSIRLAVRVSPRGGRNAVEGLREDAAGTQHLVVRVSAAPVDGEANEAVESTVAKWLGIKPRMVEIISGETARVKLLRIDGDPVALSRKLQSLTATEVAA
ncbi:DUF167 domain-containing protein [Polymorphobacter arshaanensis]|uniref:UPF0235 protein EUV02_08875 n=1 Tax=Glacieibacterium arshaanense TaxID=2511025 RepID=A0A4Y9EPL6_9SPHN|nr:DUF167 family protein [Polymorphobacter arshaanensis]TFU03289.1 DUF167 domain-containing protein [Polymorphobacter arshaanensis]